MNEIKSEGISIYVNNVDDARIIGNDVESNQDSGGAIFVNASTNGIVSLNNIKQPTNPRVSDVGNTNITLINNVTSTI